MKLRNIALTLLLAGGLSTSCIKEDHSECYNVYRLALSYTGDGKTEIFPSKINKVQMYIFDNEEKCIHQYGLTQEEVSQQRVMLPPLETGDYRIVFLGNTHSTDVKDLSTRGGLEELHFGAEAYWNNFENLECFQNFEKNWDMQMRTFLFLEGPHGPFFRKLQLPPHLPLLQRVLAPLAHLPGQLV